MIYIESESTNPYYNLALEEYVFSHMDRKQDYFILWQNSNTIVVGKYQNTAEEINPEYVDAHHIRVARRLSGGGAVYHDMGNLNYTFIVSQGKNDAFDFSLLSRPVLAALKQFGVKAEISGRNDITIDGKKFCGNSQYYKGGRLLHHGCIMLDANLNTVESALKVKEAKFESKSVKSVRSRVTTINANAPKPISMEAFKAALREAAFADRPMEMHVLTKAEQEEIGRLQKEKYETHEWNYGRNPNYHMKREKKFPSGLVTVQMQVADNAIRDIRIFGDFFGNGDIGELEQKIKGLALDRTLEVALGDFHVDDYIHGVTAAELAGMLR